MPIIKTNSTNLKKLKEEKREKRAKKIVVKNHHITEPDQVSEGKAVTMAEKLRKIKVVNKSAAVQKEEEKFGVSRTRKGLPFPSPGEETQKAASNVVQITEYMRKVPIEEAKANAGNQREVEERNKSAAIQNKLKDWNSLNDPIPSEEELSLEEEMDVAEDKDNSESAAGSEQERLRDESLGGSDDSMNHRSETHTGTETEDDHKNSLGISTATTSLYEKGSSSFSSVSPSAVESSGNTAIPNNSVTITVDRKKKLPVLSQGTVDMDQQRGLLKKVPRLGCSGCAIGPDCPEYKEGYVCAFIDSFDAFPTRDLDAVLESFRQIVGTNKARLMRAYMTEEIAAGGMLDMNTTRQSQVVLDQMKMLVELHLESNRLQVTFHGDSQEKAPGILSQLFGGSPTRASESLELNPVITVEAENKGE